ncbi:hypothetical protein [Melghirimyces algeriensis]|uniref:hypothetical protein n=1 Tax=Melghirimyces algeriensis TaxID=910412 RepID=UPI00115B0586|nr:hypothetical protein [Melghirimyces algeriensis]
MIAELTESDSRQYPAEAPRAEAFSGHLFFLWSLNGSEGRKNIQYLWRDEGSGLKSTPSDTPCPK